jgi:signal peptidase II
VSRLDGGRVIDLVWTLRLNLVRNPGSAFGLGRGIGPLLAVVAFVMVVVLIRLGKVVSTRPTAVALGSVLGGAIGNLLDRLFRPGRGILGGYVVDFVDLQWWPVFNVADSAIVVGAILLFVLQWREPDPEADAGRRR